MEIKTANGVLEIHMKLFCSYNRTQRELTHADLSHVPSVTFIHLRELTHAEVFYAVWLEVSVLCLENSNIQKARHQNPNQNLERSTSA